MENGQKPARYTGYTPSIRTAKGKGLVPRKSTGGNGGSQTSNNVPIPVVSLTSPVEASHILAVQVVMGDYKELKNQLPASWQASSNGKIYWCAELPGHKLSIVDGTLYIDAMPASILMDKLLAKV